MPRKHILIAGGLVLAAGIAAAGAYQYLLRQPDTLMANGRECAADRAAIDAAVGSRDDMVRVEGGQFTMGSDTSRPEEAPARPAEVGGFWIDRYEVTNEEFAAFVDATGYVTVAERPADPAANPGIDPDLLVPGAIVFYKPDSVSNLDEITQWWKYVPGANWRHPEGPDSSIEGKDSYPVVAVTREDALAYAQWLGRDLPTEAEWEFAARGGISDAEYVWGDEKIPGGEWQANAWQGVFPVVDEVKDGFPGAAPVGCYSANGYGLYDMAGNVWELTKDDYADLRGAQPGMVVIKGGSYLCADNYCLRYRPAARQPASFDVGTTHIGFRTVLRDDGSS